MSRQLHEVQSTVYPIPGEEELDKIELMEDGKWTLWSEQGFKQKEGCFKDGLKDGQWTFWSGNEDESFNLTYKEGRPFDGVWREWFENGQTKVEGIIQKGTGKIIHTSPDGKESSAIVYRDGKPWEGKLIYWHENGQKMSEQNIKEGLWHGRV